VITTAEIKVPVHHLDDEPLHRRLLSRQLGVKPEEITAMRLDRRSIDARSRTIQWVLRFTIWVGEVPAGEEHFQLQLKDVRHAPRAIIIGFGPAGIFAALRLIELGIKPIVLERGKDVRARRRDLAALNKEGVVNPESNYCFGEGGAGTFSDGKLYTRSNKRGDMRRVLEIFVAHGATTDILIDAHPHIGTNKLPQIIQQMRETILGHGGEVRFNARVEDILADENGVKGVKLSDGELVESRSVILATGHSARDIFEIFPRHRWLIEAKPFALGVRVEHPQSVIDSLRLHCEVRPAEVPAAAYSWVEQVHGRGVFSFCMCPGGIICPAATAEGELVVNGWSPSKRDSPFANSGIVAEVKAEDLQPFAKEGAFAGLRYQQETERKAFAAGGGRQVAPATRLIAFLKGKASADLPGSSYLPGLVPSDLRSVFTPNMMMALQQGFVQVGKKMRGYLTEEAVVVATESRTSSPVRIPRDSASLQHPQVPGLFPCGEGAGYAGGIMSAAMDGERCAEAASRLLS
jgi:uncharacterized FAD-dependent dehydrogenase